MSQKTNSNELIADRDQQNVSGLTASADPIKPDKIYVSDFGAIPDDGIDDSKAIQAAIEQASADGIHKVCFKAGKYEFKTIPGWERTERKRACYIALQDISDLELSGACDEQGLGDDSQNIHGIWLQVLRKHPDNGLVTTTSMPCLTPGKAVVLLDDQFHPAWRSHVEACTREGKEMLITFADPVPEWVHEKTPIEPQEWLPDSLHIINSVYRSTGRFGIYLKASNTLIEKCLFENNVAAIHIGGEWSWGYWLESTNSQHVEIRNCIFRDNHLDMRYGGQKMDMAISMASFTNPDKLGAPSEVLSGLINDIRIHDNLFEDESVCVSLQNCRDVWFWNNTLKNCGKDLLINEKTAVNVFRLAP